MQASNLFPGFSTARHPLDRSLADQIAGRLALIYIVNKYNYEYSDPFRVSILLF